MKRLLLPALVGLLVVPQIALAQHYLRMERDGSGVEFPNGSTYVNAVTAGTVVDPEVGIVPSGYPTEPIGCDLAASGGVTSGQCTLATAAGYGWPSLSVTPTSDAKDNYNVICNFWNNEAAMANTFPYPAGTIKDPLTRAVYTGDHTQFTPPTDYPAPLAGYNYNANGNRPDDPYVTGVLEIAVNPSPSAYVFEISQFTADSRTPASLIDERYYPAVYPAIYKGCHHGTCTSPTSGGQGGAPFPIQIRDLGTIPSNWQVDIAGEAAGDPANPNDGGSYDIGYDIWLDNGLRQEGFYNPWASTTKEYNLPEGNKYVQQPHGTEIMIWIGASDGAGGIPNPAGQNAGTFTTQGDQYDVWVGYGRDNADWNVYWNIVTFVRTSTPDTNNSDTHKSFTRDTQPFIQHLISMGNACPIGYDAATFASLPPRFVSGATTPAQTINDQPCAQDFWWLSEIQAGFEVWNDGQGLRTTAFSVNPTFNKVVSSERVLESDPNTTVINWQKYFQLWKGNTCAGGTMTYDVESSQTFQVVAGGYNWCDNQRWYSSTLSNTSDCSATAAQGTPLAMANVYGNDWYALVAPVYSKGMHGPVTVHFYCNGADAGTAPIYIDPSGMVRQSLEDGSAGGPVFPGTVTLLQKNSAGGWDQVEDGDTDVMDPALNTKNSDTTAYDGAFGWNVAPGTYKVQASMEGCHKPGDPTQAFVETEDLIVVDNPIAGLQLLLECPKPGTEPPTIPPGNLSVTLSITSNWSTGGPNGTGGYCMVVNGTNSTGASLDWTATFTLPEGGTIYDFWNATYTQSGNDVSASGISWNNILQPGKSLQDVGFCVNRGTGSVPTTHALSVSKAGSGSGTVTSSPAGISCGGDCNESYAAGTVVTLSATPASGSIFAGWGGACSGTGSCSVTMDAARSVTATFNVQPLTTRVNVTTDWGAGYCANVVVTNNGSQAVDWKVTFPIPGGQIYDFWNVIWSQSGSQATAEGVSWNNVLAAGQSTHSVGFCAKR